ncbi:uncharacterized protein TNCV_4158541 [Trichonephila clavipes]|nr:uncharacterized protein TNCV_4158541 [Trichonephila clavipes]
MAVFKEWENLGFIERVPDNEINNDGYYLPYRPVLTRDKTTKIRPVFDATTARVEGRSSLNDVLHKGPIFLDILDRFRLYPFGISADIENAFLLLATAAKHRILKTFLLSWGW